MLWEALGSIDVNMVCPLPGSWINHVVCIFILVSEGDVICACIFEREKRHSHKRVSANPVQMQSNLTCGSANTVKIHTQVTSSSENHLKMHTNMIDPRTR